MSFYTASFKQMAISQGKWIHIQTKDGLKIVRAMLIQGIFDLIAKAMALNHVQLNG